MYKVMLVDDEALILSGIKFLVDWEKNDCVVVATAGNGQAALEKIREVQPDIVLADINMPVMDGITLMKHVAGEFPHIVFIVLTNLEEFELARQALNCRAASYLLKSQLEAHILEKELEHAKAEREKRKCLMVVDAADYFERKRQEDVLNQALQEVIFFQREMPGEEYVRLLQEAGLLTEYACLYIPFGRTAPEGSDKEDKAKLKEWVQELAAKTAEKIFHQDYIFMDAGSVSCLVMFIFKGGTAWEDKAGIFGSKLTDFVKSITQAECRVFHTRIHNGKEELKLCGKEYHFLMEQYYIGAASVNCRDFDGEIKYESLGLKGIGSQLYHEIIRKNVREIQAIMDNAETRVRNTRHQKSQAIWLLNELNRETAAAVRTFGGKEASIYKRMSSAAEIENISTRKQVLQWLGIFRNTLLDIVGKGENMGNLAAKKAREYVQENIESHVGLRETAENIGVSAGYLSTVFKREYGENFIEFVNSTKIEYACRLLREKKMLVTEIAYTLGYENAYYFSKVFRKYMGMSPTNYQKHMEE